MSDETHLTDAPRENTCPECGRVIAGPDAPELTAACETAGGLSRRYEGAEALALREALQSLCVHATADEMSSR
jgi:hypothetical protein